MNTRSQTPLWAGGSRPAKAEEFGGLSEGFGAEGSRVHGLGVFMDLGLCCAKDSGQGLTAPTSISTRAATTN